MNRKNLRKAAQVVEENKKDFVTTEKIQNSAQNQETVNAPEQTKEELPMNPIQKVRFMNALAEAADNEEISGILNGMNHGAFIYDLFIESINKKLEELMGNSVSNKDIEKVNTVLGDVENAYYALQDFKNVMIGFRNSNFVQLLQGINQQLGARVEQTEQQQISQQQPNYNPQGMQQHKQPSYNQQQQNEENDYSQQPRGAGIGTI